QPVDQCWTGSGSPWHRPLSRRTVTVGVVLAGLSQAVPWLRAEAESEPVTLALDWLVNGTHAGYFVALDRGFYTDHNVAGPLPRGHGSGDTIRRVAPGHATFAAAALGRPGALPATAGSP